ncbi:MAG: ERCC4 domain-containing protein [Krumholzibacteria bacterium]|nr:ERCC4 domain-containing protein [Candidatus Krumholzibacteria bacterium]
MDGIVIAIDTREQRPYAFPGAEVKTLPTGDYSLIGLEDRVAIERKSKTDAYGSLGQGRARFRRECERLAQLDYAAVVIEDTLPGFLQRPAHSKMSPASAVGTLLAWSVRYRVPVFFAGDRAHAQALTAKLLHMYAKYHGEVRVEQHA